MRSLASLYFFIALFGFIFWFFVREMALFLTAALFGGCSLFIAIIQPCKKKYMSVTDSLILANMALIFAALDRNVYASLFFQSTVGFLVLTQALCLYSFVIYSVEEATQKSIRPDKTEVLTS